MSVAEPLPGETAAASQQSLIALSWLTGEFGALVELSKKIRNDSAAIAARHEEREACLNSREDSIAARERVHAVNVTRFVDFVGKASVLFDKLHKLRADQAEGPLATPPGSRRPTRYSRGSRNPSQWINRNSQTPNCRTRRKFKSRSPQA